MTDYIVPNFANKKVSEVENEVPTGIGVKVSQGDEDFHDPSPAEEAMEVEANGPNSQPGASKTPNTPGGWVGVKIKPV